MLRLSISNSGKVIRCLLPRAVWRVGAYSFALVAGCQSYQHLEWFSLFAGVSKDFGFIKHVTIALTAGMGLGMVYKVGPSP